MKTACSASGRETASLFRILLPILVAAVLVNYPWERVQSWLYVRVDGSPVPPWMCAIASFVDGLLILAIYRASTTWPGFAIVLLGVPVYMLMRRQAKPGEPAPAPVLES